MQTQKDIGPSSNLGPIGKAEGCNKNIYPSTAHSSKGSPDMFSKVYVRQRYALPKALPLEPVAEEPNLLKENNDLHDINEFQDKGPNHRVLEAHKEIKSLEESNSQVMEEAKQQWHLANIIGIQADIEQAEGIQSLANMESRDRKEAMELRNKNIHR